jgi:hypothetical protein
MQAPGAVAVQGKQQGEKVTRHPAPPLRLVIVSTFADAKCLYVYMPAYKNVGIHIHRHAHRELAYDGFAMYGTLKFAITKINA